MGRYLYNTATKRLGNVILFTSKRKSAREKFNNWPLLFVVEWIVQFVSQRFINCANRHFHTYVKNSYLLIHIHKYRGKNMRIHDNKIPFSYKL